MFEGKTDIEKILDVLQQVGVALGGVPGGTAGSAAILTQVAVLQAEQLKVRAARNISSSGIEEITKIISEIK